MTVDEKIAKLRKRHEIIQLGLAAGQICIREGIVLNINEASRFPFEFFCWRSPEMTREMDLFLEFSKNRKRFLDIGAHHGLFSLVFKSINPDSEICAVEPHPDTHEILLSNLNGAGRTLRSACSNFSGYINMYQEWDHLVAGPKNGQEINCCPADDLKFEPDTVKIDVEGYEIEVLEGLRHTLKVYKPVIFLEVHPSRIKYAGNDVGRLVQIFENYRAIETESKKTFNLEKVSVMDNDFRLILFPK